MRSMPLETPNRMIDPTQMSTTHCHSSEAHGLAIKSRNALEVTAGSVERIEPPMALKM